MIFGNKQPVKLSNYRCRYMPSFGFALISETNAVVTHLHGCRDFISDGMRAAANNRNDTGAGYDLHDPPENAIDFNRLRLLVYVGKMNSIDDKVDRLYRMERLVRILNLYEELAGWKEKTEAYPVEVRSGLNDCFVLLLGPKEWMRASQAVSMVTLLTRFVVRTCDEEHIPRLESVKEVQHWLGAVCRKENGCGRHVDLNTYMKYSHKLFPSIMSRYDELFPPDLQHVLLPNEHKNWHASGGIYYMCYHKTEITHVDDIIRDIRKSLDAGGNRR